MLHLGVFTFLWAQTFSPEVTYRTEVSTLAGGGRAGYKDGPADKALFNRPNGIAVGLEGEIYVSDDDNHVIRKIHQGRVTTFAGVANAPGFEDGPLEDASLNSPHGLVVSPQGVLYVCDYYNHAIRQIYKGSVTTVAGDGMPGFRDGDLKTARFNAPIAITQDSKGNLWVLETGNHALRKITPSGQVVTVAGQGSPGYRNGRGKNAAFNSPVGMTRDAQDNLYIVDAGNRVIRKVTPDGEVSTYVHLDFRGYEVRGNLSNLSFLTAGGTGGGICTDAEGNLYVADGGSHVVYQIDPRAKIVEVLAGSGRPGWIDGNGKFARFDEPIEIVASRQPRVFYVCDYRNAVIRQIKIEKIVKEKEPPSLPTPPPVTASPPPPTVPPAPPKRLPVLYVLVKDQKKPTPLSATVRVTRNGQLVKELPTSSQGSVALSLEPGTYFVSAEKKGYFPQSQTVTLSQDTLKIVLELLEAQVGALLRESRILFEPRSSRILPESYELLDQIAIFLEKNPTLRIRIHGHTDIGAVDDPQYNLRLSKMRAENVKSYLVSKGISPERIETQGHGNTKPIADNATAEGRALNRRVEFEVLAR
ncbi:MAG: OmpA family protein [Bacteroidia bacterium]